MLICIISDELRERVTGPGSSELLQKTKLLEELVSEENEVKAWMFLQTRALLLLKSYQTELNVRLLSSCLISRYV